LAPRVPKASRVGEHAPGAPILLVGDDALAERVCLELGATGGTPVRVVWPMSSERREAFLRAGAAVTPRAADADEALL
jgi:hypothetical protein